MECSWASAEPEQNGLVLMLHGVCAVILSIEGHQQAGWGRQADGSSWGLLILFSFLWQPVVLSSQYDPAQNFSLHLSRIPVAVLLSFSLSCLLSAYPWGFPDMQIFTRRR